MHPLLVKLDRYHIPWNNAHEEDDELHVQGPLPDGQHYNLYVDESGDGCWELWDGRRRHSGQTDPKFVWDVALSVLLCLYGVSEKHPELKHK